MEHFTLQVGSFEVNVTLLVRDAQALIVDPGQDADRIVAALEERHLTPEAILLTHGHFDHINAIPGLLARYPGLRVLVSEEDAKVMSHPLNTYPPEYEPVACATERPDATVAEWGGTVVPTPGHTPGGCCYYFPAERLLLSGDTLFAGSVGRTDLPGGDMATLMRSLESLRTMPGDTTVIPGHGPFTTIAAELAGNPFLQ